MSRSFPTLDQHFWILVLLLWSGCLGFQIASCTKTAAAICSDTTDAEDILTAINRRISNYFVLSAITARVKLHALSGATTYELHTFVKIAKTQNRYTLSQKRKSLPVEPHLKK